MMRWQTVLLLILWTGCAGRPAQIARPAPSPLVADAPTAELEDLDQRLLVAQNRERARRGLPSLAWDDRLAAAALTQALDCARRDKLTHGGSDGSDPGGRVRRAGYSWSAVAENAAQQPRPPRWPGDPRTPEWAVEGWMKSRGHRLNLTGRYTHAGCAHADAPNGTRYWITCYANPAPPL